MRFNGSEIRTLLPKPQASTLIVAASDSLYKERADYVCDGTADDVEIQAALDALPASGGSIFLLDGSYNISASLTIPNSNITVEGVGKSTKLINADNIQMWSATSVNNIIFKNMWLYGLDGGAADNAILFTTCLDCVVDNCIVENFRTNGVKSVTNSHRLTVQNCTFLTDTEYPLRLEDSNFSKILHNYIDGSYYGVLTITSTNVLVSHNIITNTINLGIECQGVYTIVSDNIINTGETGIMMEANTMIAIGNIISGMTQYGIYTDYNYQEYRNNLLDGCGEDGMYLNHDFLFIADNVIINGSKNGLDIVNADHCTIIDNVCNNNVRNGIRLSSSDFNIIKGNQCIDNDSGDTDTYDGINLSGDSDRNIISENYCKITGATKQRYGINISAVTCNNNKIFGNMLVSNKTGAVNDAGTDTELQLNQVV